MGSLFIAQSLRIKKTAMNKIANYYEGLYFDGQSSHANPATVRIVDRNVEICFHHKGMETTIITWHEAQIREIDSDYSGKNTIRYGTYPFQLLEVYSKDFSTALQQNYPSLNKGTPYQWLRRTGNTGLISVTLGIIVAIGLAYFYVLPWIGETLITTFVSKTYEKELSAESFKVFTYQFPKDDKKTELLQTYIKALDLETTYDIEGTVVRSNMVNAFALMGGRIVVFDSILNVMQSSDELSALLAHEITHVEGRHILKSIGKNMTNLLVIAWLTSDASSVSSLLMQNANSMMQLSYTRGLEEQADKQGFERLVTSGVNPKGMLFLMEHLKAQEPEILDDHKWSRFISDHPLTDDRIAYINALLVSKTALVDETKQQRLDSIFSELQKSTLEED